MKTSFEAIHEKTRERLGSSYTQAMEVAYLNRHRMAWVALDSATHFILAEGYQRELEQRGDVEGFPVPKRQPDGTADPLVAIFGLSVRVDDTAEGIRWDVGNPQSPLSGSTTSREKDPMTVPDQAVLDAIKVLPHDEADMLLGVIVNATAGIVSAVSALHSPTDTELYGVVSSSMPKMIEAQGGPEAAQIALAAAIVRLVRQKLSNDAEEVS